MDYKYFHPEKFSPLDALWYSQWMRLSLYFEITRQILMAVIQASIEKPERSNFMATLARILALPDEGPRTEGNPLSTRFHWRGPIHQYMWSWVQQRESPWDRFFQSTLSRPTAPVLMSAHSNVLCSDIHPQITRRQLQQLPPLRQLPSATQPLLSAREQRCLTQAVVRRKVLMQQQQWCSPRRRKEKFCRKEFRESKEAVIPCRLPLKIRDFRENPVKIGKL